MKGASCWPSAVEDRAVDAFLLLLLSPLDLVVGHRFRRAPFPWRAAPGIREASVATADPMHGVRDQKQTADRARRLDCGVQGRGVVGGVVGRCTGARQSFAPAPDA